MKEPERKFEVDKALMERQAYYAQLGADNISYEKRQEAMMELTSRVA